jgi:hypothetical protein
MISFKSAHMTKLLSTTFIIIFISITACSTQNTVTAPNAANKATIANPMPGDAEFYGFGVLQSKEDFANVEVAQLNFGIYRTGRAWEAILPNRGSVRYGALRTYYPVDVRWKLKDGREFILEDIDTAAIMREYFKTNNFLLHHQRLERARFFSGDYDPALQFGVKDDTVVIKWDLILNHTPPKERYQVSGAVNPWNTEHEEHFVIALKGKPTSGIDFSKTRD